MPDPDPALSPVVWEDGVGPRSRRFGDVYFSRDDGLAESRAVFLAGCGLPDAWAGRRAFTVGELGFGTGLNIAALLQLWEQTRRPGARLAVFTVEAEPLAAADAERALAAWPELASFATAMTARWPGRARGFHRIDLPEFAATIDVAIMEAGEAQAAWEGAADAWFLDGFAPAVDPHIWRPDVMEGVAHRSAPGARAATYTVAGAVRRSLTAAGFEIARAPGHGRKRERLEARLPAARVHEPPVPRVAIVGGGIAGAALRRAFSVLGVSATVFDAAGSGAGGSGAPAALMAPRLDAGLGHAAALFAQAARTARRLYEAIPGAVIDRGALQLTTGPKDEGRFAAIAESDLFEPGDMRALHAAEAAARLGEPAPSGLAMAGAIILEPRVVLDAWLGEVATARVASVEHSGGAAPGWRLRDADGAVLAEADAVCLATAMGTGDLVSGLELLPVRGQASFAEVPFAVVPSVFGAYALPTRRGVLIGATHDRGETTLEPRPDDRRRNLAAVAAVLPELARALEAAPLADWCAIRATTRDYLPLAGRVPDTEPGLWVLSGLGSRGFCLAPLLAEHVAAAILGAPSPLPHPLADLVDPARFAARAARKGRPQA